ncbi:MAG: hypothetical protein HYS13_14820 [Planctomycetia bacterium]|nr:hypothetical protein [Planctomycetia bacterium]
MHELVVNDAQAQLLTEPGAHVPVRDQRGNYLGYILVAPKLTEEEIAEFKRRAASNEPRFTTQEALERLSRLNAKP